MDLLAMEEQRSDPEIQDFCSTLRGSNGAQIPRDSQGRELLIHPRDITPQSSYFLCDAEHIDRYTRRHGLSALGQIDLLLY